jgi:hypothetical protein
MSAFDPRTHRLAGPVLDGTHKFLIRKRHNKE